MLWWEIFSKIEMDVPGAGLIEAKPCKTIQGTSVILTQPSEKTQLSHNLQIYSNRKH